MNVAYQGQPGAFGHEACLAFLPGHSPVAKPAFRDVLDAVSNGETELGILPAENSCAGPVPEVQALLRVTGLTVLELRKLAVRMHLLAPHGIDLDQIRRIVSHPIALAQCSRALRALGLPTADASNTAAAAKEVAESADRETAVLASEAAARIYGLSILQHDMQDRSDNMTTFCILGPPSS